MKKSLLLIIVFFSIHIVKGELETDSLKKSHRKNVALVELGGHGLMYSLGYERQIFQFKNARTSLNLNASYYPGGGIINLWVPATINHSFRLKNRVFGEFGGGIILMKDYLFPKTASQKELPFYLLYAIRVGFRMDSEKHNLVYRLAFTPILDDINFVRCLRCVSSFHPIPAFSIGKKF